MDLPFFCENLGESQRNAIMLWGVHLNFECIFKA